MLVAHVLSRLSPGDRRRALGILSAEAEAVRATAGCRAAVPFLDATDPGPVGILHEWRAGEDFVAHTASRGFAEAGRLLRRLMPVPPLSRRLEARPIEDDA